MQFPLSNFILIHTEILFIENLFSLSKFSLVLSKMMKYKLELITILNQPTTLVINLKKIYIDHKLWVKEYLIKIIFYFVNIKVQKLYFLL